MDNEIDLSVIIPVTERFDDIVTLYFKYKQAIDQSSDNYEIIYVLDGSFPEVLSSLSGLRNDGERIKVITLAKWFGEATALNIGFENSSGDLILTLPAYEQVRPDQIPMVLEKLQHHDLVIARRWPRIDSVLNRIQSLIYNRLLRSVSDFQIRDVGCGVRAMRRAVIEEVYIYGDLHRFLPIMAYRHGFSVLEINVSQSEQDAFRRTYPLGTYVRRLLDALTVFFLVKFTKKPLRFFGLLGAGTFSVGALITTYLVFERLVLGIALADRPALLLSSLLVVLGIQILAIGLIGEIVIFTHAKSIKDYKIQRIIE